MAVKPTDALTSFQHVADNIQSWRTSITELAVYVTKQHDMYVAEYSRLLSRAKTKKRKSDSIVSDHSKDENVMAVNNIAILKSPNPSELVEISPFEAGNRFIYAQAHRKRKPGTCLRSNASETMKPRSKQIVVIHYDSHIQLELDRIVKSLGTARNNLRKGKNSYTAAKGFNLPTLGRRADPTNSIGLSPSSKAGILLSKSQHTNKSASTMPEPTTVDTAFPSTDKELEAMQVLCETAAHQILRDGDCRTELNAALTRIDTVLNCVDVALGLLKTESSNDTSLALSVDGSGTTTGISTASTLCEKPSSDTVDIYPKILTPKIGSLVGQKALLIDDDACPPSVLAADAIEVDDDSGSSLADIDLQITHFRAAGRPRLVM